MRYLSFRIEDLIISENESQFFLIHTTAGDIKKAKRHELEMVIQERRTCEAALKHLEDVIRGLLVVVRKNLKEFEEQSYRNREFQLQAQNATDELSIAQVRLQQGRSFSGTNLSAVGVSHRTRNMSSSNASTTSSTSSSIYNSGSRRASSQHQQNTRRSDYMGDSQNSVPSFYNSLYQNGDPRMYLSRNNNIDEEMILGKPHSYDGGQTLQSPITPSIEHPDPYYHHSESSNVYQTYNDGQISPGSYNMDDPGFISDFGYADDYEQGFVEGNYPRHLHQKSVDRNSIWDEDITVEKLARVLYLPPDSRD